MYVRHRRRRRSLIALAAVGAVAALAPVVARLPADAQVEIRPICSPFENQPIGANTYGDPRDGGARSHEGHDIMGPKMVPLQAAAAGVVEELLFDNGAGNRMAIRDDQGWRYVYLHLNNDTPGTDDGDATRNQVFAPGIELGSEVAAGQVIAFNGDSGNAENSGAHLHFEIRQPGNGHWSLAPSIDPYPSLEVAPDCSETDGDPDDSDDADRFHPFHDATTLVERQYLDILGRPADPGGLSNWAGQVESGGIPPSGVAEALLNSVEAAERTDPVVRLYWAFFLRIPDTGGLQNWLGYARTGTPLADIAQAFAVSEEFQALYADPGDTAFVELLYANVLDRAPDAEGLANWVANLAAGVLTRGEVMLEFSESTEFVTRMAPSVFVTAAYVGMLDRAPDPGGLANWIGQDPSALVEGIFASPEYAARVTEG